LLASLVSPHEYIAELERRSLLSVGARVPEHDSDVWRAYLGLYASLVADPRDIPIVLPATGLGLYQDPLDDHHEYVWALMGAVCCPTLPLSPAQLLAALPDALAALEQLGVAEPTIVTETFEMIGPADPTLDDRFTWLNSPRARLSGSFDEYVRSLTMSRRQQLRRLLERYGEAQGFSFELSSRGPDTNELDFIVTNLARRWGPNDAPFALVQSLWPTAIARTMPGHARFMRVRHHGVLVFLNGFLVKGEVLVSQSTCKNEDLVFDGLGTLVDFEVIRALCGSDHGIRQLDPTCRISVFDPPSIEVAKRKVVNENACRPLVMAGHRLPSLEVPAPFLDPLRGWVIPEHRAVLGRPA
jgi:Acetyltransferase (GNAT) domain